jgi:hypothetical protein
MSPSDVGRELKLDKLNSAPHYFAAPDRPGKQIVAWFVVGQQYE